MIRIEAHARGRVQGVGFRFFVDDCAARAGVSGWVRNMPDGSVMMVAEGTDETIDRFLSLVRSPGRSGIRIDALEVSRHDATGEFKEFRILI